MALELRNRLEDILALQLPVTLIWNYQTIAALSRHLAEKLGLTLEAVPPVEKPSSVPESIQPPAAAPAPALVLPLLLTENRQVLG